MITYFLYIIMLLLMFLFIYYGVSFSFRFAPLKIRILSNSALLAIGLRYTAMFIFLIAGNIKNLYLLKPFIFLNLLCVPVLGTISIYIFARNDKIKLNYCILASTLFLIAYSTAVIKLPINIEIYRNLGYRMNFNNEFLVYGTYLIINTLFLFIAVTFMGNKNSNKMGMYLVLASAFVGIAEIIAKISGLHVFPAILLGDIIWLITIDYALYKLRK
jgi:hypothetical protein